MIPSEIASYLEALIFKSNPNLRPANAQISYTQEMIEEYLKCASDPIYFIKNYVKVVHPDRGIVLMDLYEYQERMILTYHENRLSIAMTARQMGKCLTINTNVKLKQKSTGEIVEVTLGEFYVWQKFKEYIRESLPEMQKRVHGLSNKQIMSDMQRKDILQ